MSTEQALAAVELLDPGELERLAGEAWADWDAAEPQEPQPCASCPDDYESAEEYHAELEQEWQEHQEWERRHREWEAAAPALDADELLDLYLASKGPNMCLSVMCTAVAELLKTIQGYVTDNRDSATCEWCRQDFTARAGARYCSDAHRQAAYRARSRVLASTGT